VALARWCERSLARRADGHLCVSRAMRAVLAAEGSIDAEVLYDRPAAVFAPPAAGAREELLQRIGESDVAGGRPTAIIVSPTSWTADEDFDLLLDAVPQIAAAMKGRSSASPPRLLLVVTGDGPLRAGYAEPFHRASTDSIALRSVWLEPDEYVRWLGAADLGLCLHRSASGVDLPMKIADLFGVGLPVCAFDYGPCLAERVRPGENGLLFRGAAQLAAQLASLFGSFPTDTALLTALRLHVAAEADVRWEAGWRREALPLFQRLAERG